MSAFRPLPPRPSLEYARKEAKALLRRLRAGDPDAMRRARERHPLLQNQVPSQIRLSDAQLIIARDHGFASWPRLAAYLSDVERQQHGCPQLHFGPDHYAQEARRLIAHHRARRRSAGRQLAAYVPRWYGLDVNVVFESTLTEDDARLAVARSHGAPSWAVLVERLEHKARAKPGAWQSDPIRPAIEAIGAVDTAALERLVAKHPELLNPSEYDIAAGRTLMGMALAREREQGAAVMKPIMDWLESCGFDRQLELNRRLCGYGSGHVDPEQVRALLDQGADPNWIAPNGIPVLEHALLRYMNGDAVDVLAAHSRPRQAFWVAAGLGDLEGVRRFLDGRGRLTLTARQHRPDAVAVGWHVLGPALPDADDEELLTEALVVAIINGRTKMVEYLVSHGAPVNSTIYGGPIVIMAMNSSTTDVLECLVRCGADLDLRSEDPNGTPRELVRSLFAQAPHDPWRRRLVTACGMDPDVLLAELGAEPHAPPYLDPVVEQALAFAVDDAASLGQSEVTPENLLIGMVRARKRPDFLEGMGLEVERFRAELAGRLFPPEDVATRRELPLHPDTTVVLDAAMATATRKRADAVDRIVLLHALTQREDGPASRLLTRFGVNVAQLHTNMGKLLLL